MNGCEHCGYTGPLYSTPNPVKAESHTHYADDIGEYDTATFWALFRCPQCNQPTLTRYLVADGMESEDDVHFERLWPRHSEQVPLPSNVAAAYDLAQRGRRVDPAFYAVGVRRTLEAICDHERVPKKGTLAKRLDALAATGRLTTELADLTTSLRHIGNMGAHEGLGDISTDDVPAVADLMEALLEYLYRAPARLAAVRASFAARGVNLS